MDKTLIFGSLFLLLLWIVTIVYVYRTKGIETVKNLIRQAEYLFDWQGAGKSKLNFVLQEANKLLKPPFKWFFNIELVERLLKTLKSEFADNEKKKDELHGKEF